MTMSAPYARLLGSSGKSLIGSKMTRCTNALGVTVPIKRQSIVSIEPSQMAKELYGRKNDVG
jgi:hypothetical protein